MFLFLHRRLGSLTPLLFLFLFPHCLLVSSLDPEEFAIYDVVRSFYGLANYTNNSVFNDVNYQFQVPFLDLDPNRQHIIGIYTYTSTFTDLPPEIGNLSY